MIFSVLITHYLCNRIFNSSTHPSILNASSTISKYFEHWVPSHIILHIFLSTASCFQFRTVPEHFSCISLSGKNFLWPSFCGLVRSAAGRTFDSKLSDTSPLLRRPHLAACIMNVSLHAQFTPVLNNLHQSFPHYFHQ